MSALLSALPGRWALLDGDTVWWQAVSGGRSEFLELREHAALAACTAYRTRDEHVTAFAPPLGLTTSRAARLFDALVERGLVVAAAVPATPAAATIAAPLIDVDGPRNDALVLAHAGARLRFTHAGASRWLAPAGVDPRISLAPETVVASAMVPVSPPDAAALLGRTWPQVAAGLGVASESLAGQPHEALAHWREAVVVRAVVGGASRTCAAPALPAPLLALDATALVPFALLDGDADSAWLVTALDAMYGRGSVLALPVFRPEPVVALPIGTLALFGVLARAAARFVSSDAQARLVALCATAAGLADADAPDLARMLRRDALRTHAATFDDAALEIDAQRELAARIAAGGAPWLASWRATTP